MARARAGRQQGARLLRYLCLRPTGCAAWQQCPAAARLVARLERSLLTDLIATAQNVSPTLASAAARIAQARVGATNTTAAMLPHAGRAGEREPWPHDPALHRCDRQQPLRGWTTAMEIDLFGGLNHARKAADARLNAAQALWHDARYRWPLMWPARYFSLRACQRGLDIMPGRCGVSQPETARLTAHLGRAGFCRTGDTLALAQAGAAQALAQRDLLRRSARRPSGDGRAHTVDEEVLRQRLQPPRRCMAVVAGGGVHSSPSAGTAPDVICRRSGVGSRQR